MAGLVPVCIKAAGIQNAVRVPTRMLDHSGAVVDSIDANGFNRVEYRDEYPGDEWTTPQGAGSTPSVATVETIAGVQYRTRQFAHNAENQMSNMFEIQHDFDPDYALEFHVHCSPSTDDAGAVKWFFDWAYLPPNIGAPEAMATQNFIIDFPLTRKFYHFVEGVELPVPTGGYEIGGLILFNVRRTPSDGADTYGAPVIFHKCALHIPTNSRGSRARYTK